MAALTLNTARDYIETAAEELKHKAAEVPMEPDDMRGALLRFNAMLEEWEQAGLRLGATAVMSETDVIRVSKGLKYAVMVNLAGRLAPFLRTNITPELAAEIKAANRNLYRSISVINNVKFPDTLPRGSGNNDCIETFNDDEYFDQFPEANF